MRLLYLKWKAFGNDYMLKALRKAGFECFTCDYAQDTDDTRRSEEVANKVVEKILEYKVDYVFSFDFFVTVAVACKACRVKYISWTYDSPYVQLYSQAINYDTNYAFIFDKNEYNKLKSHGVDTIYYLPMAVDIESYNSIIVSDNDRKKYSSDISMVGSMYTEKRQQLYKYLDKLDDYTKGYLDAVIETQQKIYGMDILESSLTADIVEALKEACPMQQSGDGFETLEWVYANYFLARKVTSIERERYLDRLSIYHNVAIYTPEPTPKLKKVDNRGTVDYYNEAPKVFKSSKINLNITLRSIVTGIPLRAFDIMGCGGFLLSNYQEDFFEFIEADKDFVYFDSEEDLCEKASYYLKNDTLREQIALSGYEKVKNYHTYNHRVEYMLKIINKK